MKLLVLFLLSSFYFVADAKGISKWLLLENKNSSSVYSLDKKSETLLVLQKSQDKKIEELNTKIASEYEESKRQVLKLAGIVDWKINHRQLTTTRMEWTGSYTNGRKELIYFFEVHMITTLKNEVHYLLTSRSPITDKMLTEVKGQEGEFIK